MFFIDFTKKLRFEDEGPTSSIIEDHWPLIAGGAAILFVLLIAIFVCCCIRRRKRKKGGKLAFLAGNKEYNFLVYSLLRIKFVAYELRRVFVVK